jgi:hypothetical protein
LSSKQNCASLVEVAPRSRSSWSQVHLYITSKRLKARYRWVTRLQQRSDRLRTGQNLFRGCRLSPTLAVRFPLIGLWRVGVVPGPVPKCRQTVLVTQLKHSSV